jgi:hypothetical protein
MLRKRVYRWVSLVLLAMARAVRAVAGGVVALLEELTVAAGLVLVVIGLWPWLQQSALLVPGAVLIWMALPTRARFVEPPSTSQQKER